MDLEFTEFSQEKEELLTLGEDDFTVSFEGEFAMSCGAEVFACLHSLYGLAIDLQCRDGELSMTEINDQSR